MGKIMIRIAIVLVFMNIHEENVHADTELEIEPVPVMQVGQEDENDSFNVAYSVNDGQVYVETYIPDFSFYANQHQMKDMQGYLVLRVNDDYEMDVHQAAFKIKGLEPGSHTIELEAYDEDNKPLGLKETFSISISD